MNKILNGLLADACEANKELNKNLPAILLGLSITGIITTFALIAKEAPIVERELEELHEDQEIYDEVPETKVARIVEDAKVALPIYAPAIILGSLSLFCNVKSYSINMKRIAGLLTAYELQETFITEYKEKVKEKFGEKKEREVRDEIDQDHINAEINKLPNEMWFTVDGKFPCQYGLNWLRTNEIDVQKAANEITHRLITEDFVSVAEFLYELGAPSDERDEDYGWSIGEKVCPEVTYGKCPNGEPCLVLHLNAHSRIAVFGDLYYH